MSKKFCTDGLDVLSSRCTIQNIIWVIMKNYSNKPLLSTFFRATFAGLLFFALFLVIPTVYASPISQSDLNNNGINDSTEVNVVVDTNATLPAGEYTFQNLTITNYAVLKVESDPDSSDSFKGTKITVDNLTVDQYSSILADGQGYPDGPGASSQVDIGATYSGVGGNNPSSVRYGSAVAPTDLGSGIGGSIRGGGAIRLVVGGTLKNDGEISADGLNYGSSGGSIYITTDNLAGAGNIHANGGGIGWPYRYTGGGGRVAVHYQNSSYTGTATARAGMYCFYGCAPTGESGTAGFFDVPNNDLIITSYWRFQKNDEPSNFNDIIFKNGSTGTAEVGAVVSANSLLVDERSFFNFEDNQVLNIPDITINNYSVMTLSGAETINANSLIISENSKATVFPEKVLSLNIPNISIDTYSIISADGKGYEVGPGSPEDYYESGASHGGVGGGVNPKPVDLT